MSSADSSEPPLKKSKPNSPIAETDPTFKLHNGDNVDDSEVKSNMLGSPMGFVGETPTPFDDFVGNVDLDMGLNNNDATDQNIGDNSIYHTPLPTRLEPSTNLNKDSNKVSTGEVGVDQTIMKDEPGKDTLNPNNQEKVTHPQESADSVTNQELKPVASGLALPQQKNDKKKNSKKSQARNSKDSTKNEQPADANKMSDVLFSAGVDIREEEALLSSSVNASKNQTQSTAVNIPEHPPFLHPMQVSTFMKKIAKEQAFNQDFTKNNDILSMVSAACEAYMKDLLTNTIIISRHRRRAVKLNSGRRSAVSVALRNIAINQKRDEERRVKKRIALGLEKEDTENKIDSEETLHRASNATAGLRAGSKKQYGWLTSSTNKPLASNAKTTGKIAAAVQARGDIGLKFREAREEPGIVMRDLLFALENRRIGTSNVITKGYSRIRD